MTRRPRFAVVFLAAFAAACSRSPEVVPTAAPTAPSPVAVGEARGVSGPATVGYPGRGDTVDFRNQLETKYRSGLGRPAAQTVVDGEGEAAWIGEYHRYRVNGCDHNTATQYALTQIDGNPPPQVCSVRFFPETAIYPSREELVDFRRQLATKYQQLGRNAQSSVDPEGAAIWIGEYLRYRTSGCDHPTAVQKTLAQVDGVPASESCLVTCVYRLAASSLAVPATGGTFSIDVERTSGSCSYVAFSEHDWITMTPPLTGSGRVRQGFTVVSNSADARTGYIRFQYPGGAAYLEVNQGSFTPLSFQFFDLPTTTNPTTECNIRSTATTCTLTATTPTPVAGAIYDWRVEYAYNGSKVKTQTSASPSFSFTESCGNTVGSGTVVPIQVRLIATAPTGQTGTVTSGQGTQPALNLRIFTCP